MSYLLTVRTLIKLIVFFYNKHRMSIETAIYFVNPFSEQDLGYFNLNLSEAFEGVPLHSNRKWTPSDKQEIMKEYLKERSITFFGPHYYTVTFYRKLICVERLSRVKVLADEKYRSSIISEINGICRKLGAKKVLYTNSFEVIEDFALNSNFDELVNFMSGQVSEEFEIGSGTINELANNDCDFCLLEIE